MSRMSQQPWRPPQQPAPVVIKPRRRRMRWHVRRDYIVVPLVCLVAYWFISRSRGLACSWNDVMLRLGVHDRENYTRLALCGLSLVAFVAIARVLKKQPRE